jgi:hypothetical protein
MTIRHYYLSAVVLVAACRSVQVSPRTELESHHRAWQALRLSDYSFSYRQLCFYAGSSVSYRVNVIGGKVVSLDHGLLPSHMSSKDLRRPTIDSLFVWMDDSYTRNSELVRVVYNPKYHFPADVNTDWRKNVMDDEFSFVPGDLRPVVTSIPSRR